MLLQGSQNLYASRTYVSMSCPMVTFCKGFFWWRFCLDKVIICADLILGGYFHAVNDLSYGVDIQQMRIMGVLQVLPLRASRYFKGLIFLKLNTWTSSFLICKNVQNKTKDCLALNVSCEKLEKELINCLRSSTNMHGYQVLLWVKANVVFLLCFDLCS